MNFHIIYASGTLCYVSLIKKKKKNGNRIESLGHSLKNIISKPKDINNFL
jgi:hypothetical protein